MVTKLRRREREQRRRKEHGFVIGMGDQETNALVADLGKGGAA